MTYAFGTYADPESGFVRSDLDWIKSDQIRKDKSGKRLVRDFKKSYKGLAERIGLPLSRAVDSSKAVDPDSIIDVKEQKQFCSNVIEYQLNRIGKVFEDDPELKSLIPNLPKPKALFAPYFYIEPTRTWDWLKTNNNLMKSAVSLETGMPIHGVVCADVSHLDNAEFRKRILAELPQIGIKGVWLWFSKFQEERESINILRGYREIVSSLADSRLEVYSMHGGLFSLCLSKYGMSGISHGIGYGEQKDVVPVIGQSTPTVRYYLPALAKRLGVPDIERAFDALGVKTPKDFHEKVCDCAVCKGII
jgi:hypothetical protein